MLEVRSAVHMAVVVAQMVGLKLAQAIKGAVRAT